MKINDARVWKLGSRFDFLFFLHSETAVSVFGFKKKTFFVQFLKTSVWFSFFRYRFGFSVFNRTGRITNENMQKYLVLYSIFICCKLQYINK